MADAIISVAAERITSLLEEQIRNEVNLVRGVEKEVQRLSSELDAIKNVLEDAESRRFKDKNINNWMRKLEHMAYEIEDVLDEWNYAILKFTIEHQFNDDVASEHKVCSFTASSSCLCFRNVVGRRDIAKKIKHVKEQLDELLKEKDRYDFVMSQPNNYSAESWRVQSISSIDLAEIHGRDFDRDTLVSKIMSNCRGREELGLHILSIVGVGGLGKTTLAQLVYNDNRVNEFFELRIWICVSDPFDEAAIAKGIIERVGVGSSPNTNQLDIVCEHLKKSIEGKKFLLVLDDVWTEDYSKWEPLKNTLKCGGAGSVVLVTTRNERVAKVMGTTKNDIHRLGLLSDEDCWFLLCQVALVGRDKEKYEKLEGIGKNIAKKCKGLPLAAKALGSVLRFKNTLEEWENVLNSEIWELEEAEVDLFPHLLLSYNQLSPALKRCFSYCAFFPKDSVIEVEHLIRIWMAQGCLGFNNRNAAGDMELKGREYFHILAMRSLFQDFKKDDLDELIKSFKMHDIVHDFAQFIRKNSRVEAAGMKKTTCQVCSPELVSSVKEYRSLFRHFDQFPPDLCDCLRSLRALGLTSCKLDSVPQGIENLIHLRLLDLSDNTLEDTKTIYKLYNLQFLWLSYCGLQEIPREIGNLIHLTHLDLSFNWSVHELPESMCGLHELRTLNVDGCSSLRGLPQGIHTLINLKHLHNKQTDSLVQFPRGLAQLTGLRTLTEFCGGSGWSKMGLLKNLNHLSGSLKLFIRLTDDDFQDLVEDARNAELRKKIRIQNFELIFYDRMDENESSARMDVIDAVEPHPNLQNLSIRGYNGSNLPSWIASLKQLRHIYLSGTNHLSTFSPLEKLPCLEEIVIEKMHGLKFLGRDFLGTTIATTGDYATSTIGFAKLKALTFRDCPNWTEWEDMTAEEEKDSTTVLFIMPCLAKLTIENCDGLMALPHRLLGKLSSLEVVDIYGSRQLRQLYGYGYGSAWKSISQKNPHVRLKF